MEGSSALQRLVNVLERSEYVASKIEERKSKSKDKSEAVYAFEVLVSAMGFPSSEPYHILEIYSLANAALKEAGKLDKVRTKKHYKALLEDVVDFFSDPRLHNRTWVDFQGLLLERRILISLDSLADSYSNQFPRLLLLEEKEVNIIYEKFTKLSQEIIQSNLSEALKNFLLDSIERMLNALRRYKLDGTEGLQKVSKELISDWITIEPKLSEQEVKKPVLRKTLAWFATLNSFLGVNLLSLMGVAPTYLPTVQKLIKMQEVVEMKSINQDLSLQQIICEATEMLNERDVRALEGVKEPKALPPGEDKKTNPKEE